LEGTISSFNNSGLSIKGVCKTFDPRKGPVLRNIDLDVPSNSFFALLGPSGCGKSTLLRIIAGLETLDSGTVTLNGEDITAFPANQRKVNTVFQNFALFPHLTVSDNIAFGLKAQGKFEAKKDLFFSTIQSLELDGMEDRYPDQLSDGQQQRVALARALVNEPQVLLLDEPMSHLDEYLKAKVSQDLLGLQRKNKTIFLMVTHDREEAMGICSCMAVLNKGQIAQLDKPHNLYFSPKSVFVAEFMGKANIFDGSVNKNSVVLPFYSDAQVSLNTAPISTDVSEHALPPMAAEASASASAPVSGKILINPELIGVKKRKKERKIPAEVSVLEGVKLRLGPEEADEEYSEGLISWGMAANGEIIQTGDPVQEDGFDDGPAAGKGFKLKSAKKQKKLRKRLENRLEVDGQVEEVRYKGYATELQCSVPNTGLTPGRSTLQILTNTKESWKKGDNLTLFINKKDLKVLEAETAKAGS
jgi:ABC-type Fe3+/spermidine/putrescine transport system ATPase subunit